MKRSDLLRRLVPCVLILWIAADVALRLLPPSVLSLDPWLVVSQFPNRFSPFSPNKKFRLPVYVGGNALMANLRPTEHSGPIDFSTNQLGFRLNPYVQEGQTPNVLFVKGDSFIYGVGLSDEQTLPSVLTRKYGIPAFNGARFHDQPDGLPELDWLIAQLGHRPKTVVYTLLEHQDVVSPAEEAGWKGRLERRNPRVAGDLFYARSVNTFFWQLSPTKVLSTRVFKRLANGDVLPNAYSGAAKELRLPNGQRMLFRDYEFGLPDLQRGPEDIDRTGRYFAWLKAEMDRRGIHLSVLLLPTRYTVYAPLLEQKDGEWTHYLDRISGELQSRNIDVLNGLDVFRRNAPAEIRSGQLSFYREDTHWNSRGVESIADALWTKLDIQPFQIASELPHVVQ